MKKKNKNPSDEKQKLLGVPNRNGTFLWVPKALPFRTYRNTPQAAGYMKIKNY